MIGGREAPDTSKAWFIQAEEKITKSLMPDQLQRCNKWIELYCKGYDMERVIKRYEDIAESLDNLCYDSNCVIGYGWDYVDTSDFDEVWQSQREELLTERLVKIREAHNKIDNEQFELMHELRKEIGEDKIWYLWVKVQDLGVKLS